MKTIEERMNKIEQSLRVWRRVALGLGLTLVLVISVAAANQDDSIQDVIQVKRLLVVNDEGKVAAQINGNAFGGSLKVYGKGEKESLSYTPGYLTIKNDNEKIIFSLERDGNAGSLGNGLLGLQDKNGGPIVQIGQTNKGDGFMQIQNKDGKNTMYGPSYR